MKIDFDQPMLELDGSPIVDGGKTVTLKDVALRALTTPMDDDRAVNGEAAFKRLELARRVYKGGTQDVDPGEAVTIRDRAARIFTVVISGQAYELLKG